MRQTSSRSYQQYASACAAAHSPLAAMPMHRKAVALVHSYPERACMGTQSPVHLAAKQQQPQLVQDGDLHTLATCQLPEL